MQSFKTCASKALRQTQRRAYSSATSDYTATRQNLRINKDTRVIVQGFTGKQGCSHRYRAEEQNVDMRQALSIVNRPSTMGERDKINVSTWCWLEQGQTSWEAQTQRKLEARILTDPFSRTSRMPWRTLKQTPLFCSCRPASQRPVSRKL